jgi:CheY-like chemotaxis protein
VISLTHDAASQRVVVELEDNGPGVPREIAAKVFEAFFTTKPPGEGTGLGLSICRSIIEAHGGTIGLVETAGQGAIFHIELPVRDEVTTAAPAAVAGQDPAQAARILVVDDEREIAEVLAEILALDGHRAEIALSGTDALNRLASGRYELVLIDVRMPGLDGPGVFNELQRRDPALARRLVFITGDDLSPQTRAFLEALPNTRLKKPFDVNAVRKAVNVALAGTVR